MFEILPLAPRILLAAVAVIAGYYDIRWRRIPNWLVLAALALGLALDGFRDRPWHALGMSGIGLGLAMLVYLPLYLLRGMGAGDVKLMAALGAIMGPGNWMILFVLTGAIGLIVALAMMLMRRRFWSTLKNTGYIIWEMLHLRAPHRKGEEFDVKSPRAFRLPHGAVIALGCVALLGIMAKYAG